MPDDRRRRCGAPVLLRVAGLPASTMADFHAEECANLASRLLAVEHELAAARSALADALHAAIGAATAAERRLLLTVRRDCFNGRPLARHREARGWETVGSLAAVDAVLRREADHAALAAELRSAVSAAREMESARLFAVAAEPALLRGIALASPVLGGELASRIVDGMVGRRRRKAEISLLRFVSRAALKLSPYSSFTRLALGAVTDDVDAAPTAAGAPLRWEGGPWGERSLLRLKRYAVDQCIAALLEYPPLRAAMPVGLNDTVEEVAPGRLRFLRPGHWGLHPQQAAYRYHLAALVQADLRGPLIDWLRQELPRRRLTFGELPAVAGAQLLADDGDAAAGIAAIGSMVERLTKIGFLCLLPPWSSHEGHLEKRLAAWLDETRPHDPLVAPLRASLGRLVKLQEGYAAASDPVAVLGEIERRADEVWAAAAPLAGLPADVERSQARRGRLYEDAMVTGAAPEVLRLPAAEARSVLADVAPFWQFLDLYNHRHDLGLALAAFAAERWPGRQRVGLIELFSAFQATWLEFVRFTLACRRESTPRATFAPFATPAVDLLRSVRAELWRDAAALVAAGSGDDGVHIDASSLAVLAARIPRRFRPAVGPCLFVQAAAAGGARWVVNRIFEGTGRYGSRYTPLMDDAARRSYAAHLVRRSAVWDQGERCELLDLACVQGDTLNVHAAQTQWMLESPGEPLGVPAGRRLELARLHVRLDGVDASPRLCDDAGQPYLPVHLGGAGSDFLPTLHKFVALLGPADAVRLALPSRARREPGAPEVPAAPWVDERLTLGSLVLQRRRWIVACDDLVAELARLEGSEGDAAPAGAAGYLAVQRWRLAQRLPERLFFIERVASDDTEMRYKPQYLDFTSPLFIDLFRSSLRHNASPLTFEEMLPGAGSHPRDGAGQPWAVELMLDALALGEPAAPAAAAVAGVVAAASAHPSAAAAFGGSR